MRHATEPAEPALGFQYRFRFKDGSAREFLLELDPSTLALRRPEAAAEQPPWTRLGYYQCSNCPLKESQQPRCPIAAHLVGVVEFFGDRVSVERVDVAVETQGRTYSKVRVRTDYARTGGSADMTWVTPSLSPQTAGR